MNYNTLLSRFCFLLAYADGSINDKEIASAKKMIKIEGISEGEFTKEMESLKWIDKTALFSESMDALKRLSQKQQVRIVAWLCVIANADGFMDRAEWQLIYKIYHKELSLSLHEIFEVQKELNRLNWENPTVTIL